MAHDAAAGMSANAAVAAATAAATTGTAVAASSSVSASSGVHAVALSAFVPALEALCIAAGPPAPSFSLQDIDACIAHVLDHTGTYSGVFAAIDRRLSLDAEATPLSVRAMLWSLLTRFCERAWAGPRRHEEWSALLAPQLYRIVMLVLPKFEDATGNVTLTRNVMVKWMAQAEAGGPAPFKRHQLLNAIKYVEGYTYEPPQPTDTDRLERKERKREKRAKKRHDREVAEERSRKKQRRDASNESRSSSPRSPNSATADSYSARSRSRSGSRSPSSSRSRSGSRSRSHTPTSPTRLRYLNRTTISHTAGEEAAASRFLEHIRASQKRNHVDATLRPAGESVQSWEEWEETRASIRKQRQLQSQELQQQQLDTSPCTSAAVAASSPPVSSSPAPSLPLSSFLSSWLSTRNHWKATRDALGEYEGELSEGGQHDLDIWLDYFQQHQLTLPSQAIPHGAQRLWSKLNEPQAVAMTRQQGLLLPRPPPARLYATAPAAASTS